MKVSPVNDTLLIAIKRRKPNKGLIIEIFYNRKRLHSYNNYMPSTDFEKNVT